MLILRNPAQQTIGRPADRSRGDQSTEVILLSVNKNCAFVDAASSGRGLVDCVLRSQPGCRPPAAAPGLAHTHTNANGSETVFASVKPRLSPNPAAFETGVAAYNRHGE
jgi:hypothetical protein